MYGQLFSAALFIGVGLLFIDLVPIQENMMCPTGSYANVTECPDAVFSQTYFEARGRFRTAATAAGASLSEHVVVEADGVRYTMDAAFLQGRDKTSSLLVHVSGVHGVEGYIGSAIQTDLLRRWNSSRGDGPSVLFIHAVNPYGFAHYRRFNEHNVDLNRNCFYSESEWDAVRHRDPNMVGYEDVKSMLYPAEVPTLFDRYALLVKGAVLIAQHGFIRLKRTFVTGQYHHPEGPYYGGSQEEPSVSILKKVVSEYRDFTKVFVIDVHSGLGPEGVDTIMVNSQHELTTVRSVLPDTASFKIEAPDETSGASAGYDQTVGFINYRPMFTSSVSHSVLQVTEEFGTVPGIFVARALILENAAYQLARGSYIHRVTQDWLRDAFYPQKQAFKRSVLQRGSKLFDTVFGYLSVA